MADAAGAIVGLVPVVMSVGVLDKTMDMSLGGKKSGGSHRRHRHRRRK